jgi:hypothetical protein
MFRMETIKAGETILPSGKIILRLALLSRRGEGQSFKLLMADDGATIYARQYPHLDRTRPDVWDPVGPFAGSAEAAYAAYGFDKQDLMEFIKDA